MGKFILMCYVLSFGIFFSLLGTGYLIMKIAERVRKRRPRTHADMIRNMSDEELAELISHPKVNYCQKAEGTCTWDDDCAICCLEWLKKEVDDEHTD